MSRKPQPLPVRIAHWVNVPVIVVMAMSGLQILVAYPQFGPQGAQYSWMPQNFEVPETLRLGGWLAGARHLHFAFAWLLLANGIAYLIYLIASGEFRRRWFWPPRDGKPAVIQTIAYLDRARYAVAWVARRTAQWIARRPIQPPRPPRPEPPSGLYNGLQRGAYTVAMLLGIALVGSGLAMWKPVQLHRLAWLFGGYDGARVVHFLALVALGLFVVGHLVMVAIHWRAFPEIITGGRRGTKEGES